MSTNGFYTDNFVDFQTLRRNIWEFGKALDGGDTIIIENPVGSNKKVYITYLYIKNNSTVASVLNRVILTSDGTAVEQADILNISVGETKEKSFKIYVSPDATGTAKITQNLEGGAFLREGYQISSVRELLEGEKIAYKCSQDYNVALNVCEFPS